MNKLVMKKDLFGKLVSRNKENISNISFSLMVFIMHIMEFFVNYYSKKFKTFAVKSDQIVIDYGCGPGMYIKDASIAVGNKGKVIAVDIHPLAIKKVRKIITKYEITNVEVVMAKGYHTFIKKKTADLIYAIDIFHMIEKPKYFLAELSRLIKKDGFIIIGKEHQDENETREIIEKYSNLQVLHENQFHVKCCKI